MLGAGRARSISAIGPLQHCGSRRTNFSRSRSKSIEININLNKQCNEKEVIQSGWS